MDNKEDIEVEIWSAPIDSSVCDHKVTFVENTTTFCRLCGKNLFENICRDQEWRNFDSSEDQSRCQYKKTQESGIKKELERMGFPVDVINTADVLYQSINEGKIKRSKPRKTIIFACVFDAYKLLGNPQTHEKLLQKFENLSTKDAAHGIKYFKENCNRDLLKLKDVSPENFIKDIMDKFNINEESTEKVIKLYNLIKDKSIFPTSKFQDVAKAAVLYFLKYKKIEISSKKYSSTVDISEVVLVTLYNEICTLCNKKELII